MTATPLLAVLLAACADSAQLPTTPNVTEIAAAATASAGVIHRVSVAGVDRCEAAGLTDCTGNISATAIMRADGSVTGMWRGKDWESGENYQVAVDCLNVQGNGAAIGGVITRGPADRVGVPVQLVIFDNGTSAHDPPDQITPTYIGFASTCTDNDPSLAAPLWDVSRGQVTVE